MEEAVCVVEEKETMVVASEVFEDEECRRTECLEEFEARCAQMEARYEEKMKVQKEDHEAAWAAMSARLANELKGEFAKVRDDFEARLAAQGASAATALAEKSRELEMVYETFGPTVKAQREAQVLLVEARAAAVEASKRRPEAVPVKVMGVLDPGLLTPLGMSAEEISSLQERIRHPDFHPMRVVVDGEKCREEFDRTHPELVSLECDFGPKAVDEVLRCFKELVDWNPSSRYSVKIPWDSSSNSELKPADVIKRLAAHRSHHHRSSASRGRHSESHAAHRSSGSSSSGGSSSMATRMMAAASSTHTSPTHANAALDGSGGASSSAIGATPPRHRQDRSEQQLRSSSSVSSSVTVITTPRRSSRTFSHGGGSPQSRRSSAASYSSAPSSENAGRDRVLTRTSSPGGEQQQHATTSWMRRSVPRAFASFFDTPGTSPPSTH